MKGGGPKLDNAVDKVMGSKVIEKADKMTESTGAFIKKTGSFLATPVTGPVKKLGEVISKKLENTCDVVTTIQASDCEGNVINTVNLYGCITSNDLVPIIDVILNKMQIVLWPCISQKNNVIMKFLVNHVLHWFLFWFYIGCIFDIFKSMFENTACDIIDKHYEYTAPLIKGFFGLSCYGNDNVFEHPLSDGWWDPHLHGRCDDNYYRKKCPYNNSKKDYMTDMTLWAGEEATLGGSLGEKNGGFENPGEICDSITQCSGSFGTDEYPMGIGDGNAPRKYKECCEFNVRYITGDFDRGSANTPGKSMPLIPSGDRALCDLDEYFAGAKELLKCAAEDVGNVLLYVVTLGYADDIRENECKNIGQAIANKANREYINCINARVKATGCGDYFQMVYKDGETPDYNDGWGGPGWIHANNSIYKYTEEHPSPLPPPLSSWPSGSSGVNPTKYLPTSDGKPCDPNNPDHANDKDCFGPFREPTYNEKWIGGYDCMKDIPIFDFIKYLYRVIFLIFIFLWLFKITDGSSFGRVMIFILLGLYVWLRV